MTSSSGIGLMLATFAVLSTQSAAGFDFNFGKGSGLDLSNLPDHISEIKQVVSDAAEKVSQSPPEDVADMIHQVTKDKLQEAKTIITSNLDGTQNVTEALKTTDSGDLAKAIKSTAAAITDGLKAVQNTSAEDLSGKITSIQQVTTDHLLKQIGSNDTKELVDQIEKIHDEAVDLVDEHGDKVARTFTKNVPEAAHFLAHGTHSDHYQERHLRRDGTENTAALCMGVGFATFAAFAGGYIAFRTYKAKDSRSLSVLLADADNEMTMSGPSSIRPDDSQDAVFRSF